MRTMRDVLHRYRLATVCEGAICPNTVECWGERTATFMLLGEVCTRACRFCAVPTGDPCGAVDRSEPDRIAAAVGELGLRYVVLTSVDRDDLPDGGAGLFAATIERVKAASEGARVEALIPDFGGDRDALAQILATDVDVLGHNVETVPRLSPTMRDRRAGYRLSLDVLTALRDGAGRRWVKSGLMVGLGETREEIVETLQDLRGVGVDRVTIGQYLRPTEASAPVARFVPPTEFDDLACRARTMGYASVVAGPLVRSSYHAALAFAGGCAP